MMVKRSLEIFTKPIFLGPLRVLEVALLSSKEVGPSLIKKIKKPSGTSTNPFAESSV